MGIVGRQENNGIAFTAGHGTHFVGRQEETATKKSEKHICIEGVRQMDVALRVSGGAPKKKKKKGGLEPSFTTEQISEMWKEVMDDHEDVKDELLDQWNEEWSKSHHENDELLRMARQYGVCVSSIVARLQGKSLTHPDI